MFAPSLAAFLSALFVGVSLHYKKIVQNEWYSYPEEWFPSVSATIGDRYPERSFFMVFIAITSGTPVTTPPPIHSLYGRAVAQPVDKADR